ncbi:MAG: hypothetical protein Athens101428_263 [Candidatus Berkelbacteria bacterium Athens1014_28]|uniref:50S ribosomal protein L7/L12 n=1 Tax=Candidatus Berkelbacteria bacterium Athens1014_28 TaxID=2017145 RepID=A0A554LP01_9BACT|nr:MAG: hypothetical protein Athens101428_263 [Candidatus Berkelbacteria bacterium Athens1014_28]
MVEIKQLLDSAESQIRKAKSLIFSGEIEDKAKEFLENDHLPENIIEGVFDGLDFVAPGGKKYPIAPNYSSKSKLVTGDHLKLTILEDGSFVYKQINPVEREKVIGVLESVSDDWQINVEGKLYNVLTASVTYYKAKTGDKIAALVPAEGESNWAAMDNVISD